VVLVDKFTTALELLGAVLIVVGMFLWWIPAGFMTAGVTLVGLGLLLAPEPSSKGARR
jgi:hypothetical protein